jgi:hypothetical protein
MMMLGFACVFTAEWIWIARELHKMEIEIVYKTWQNETPIVRKLTPEEYFDELDAGQTYEVDGIAKHDHTWEYIDVPLSSLEWTSERRSGTTHDRTHFTQYMGNGRSWLNHRVDANGYEEMVHETQLDGGASHLVRTVKMVPTGRWAVRVNCIVSDSEVVQSFDDEWTSEIVEKYSSRPR